MNKNDIKLLIVVILIIIILFILIYFNNDKGNIAKVYYENDLIKTINLKTNNIYKDNILYNTKANKIIITIDGNIDTVVE